MTCFRSGKKNKSSSTTDHSVDILRDQWEGLGIAFSFNISKAKQSDPEKTLIAIMWVPEYFLRKMFLREGEALNCVFAL